MFLYISVKTKIFALMNTWKKKNSHNDPSKFNLWKFLKEAKKIARSSFSTMFYLKAAVTAISEEMCQKLKYKISKFIQYK